MRRAQLAFGALLSGQWAFTVAIGVVAFRHGGAGAVGLVAFARTVPSAALAPLGAALADRWRRERVMVWAAAAAAATIGLAAVLVEAPTGIVGVYALAVVSTAAYTLFRPAHAALLPGLCRTPIELTSANVMRGLMDSLSILLGPALAALLLAVSGPAAVFAVAAVLSAVAAALVAALSYEAPPRPAPQPLARIAAETVEGFRVLARHRDAGVLIGVALAQTFTRGCLNVFLVVVPIALLGAGEAGVGVLTAAIGVGALAGSLAAWLFIGGRRLAALEGVGVAVWGLALVVSGALPSRPVLLATMAAVGIGNALVGIGLFTVPARIVPEAVLARVFGALESLIALTVALGSLITPLAIHLLGIRGALALVGLVGPALVLVAWARLRAIDGSLVLRDADIDVLREVGMLRVLPVPAIETLAAHLTREQVEPGCEVVRQGEHGDRFFIIEQGEADVIGDGRQLHALHAGQCFGEIALLRDDVRTATVRARTPLRLAELERHDFLGVVTGYPSTAREAETLVVDRLARFTPGSAP